MYKTLPVSRISDINSTTFLVKSIKTHDWLPVHHPQQASVQIPHQHFVSKKHGKLTIQGVSHQGHQRGSKEHLKIRMNEDYVREISGVGQLMVYIRAISATVCVLL